MHSLDSDGNGFHEKIKQLESIDEENPQAMS